jgi:hypothetical protein
MFLGAAPASAQTATLESLQQQWWQWASTIPPDINPTLDETGEFCHVGQRGPYWFLASNGGGATTRSCTVPKGVKLVVPTFTTMCYPEEGFDDNESCLEYVGGVLDHYNLNNLTVRVDGVLQEMHRVCELAAAQNDLIPIQPDGCFVRRRANRTLFTFVIPEGGLFPSVPGVWRANGANGVWSVIDTRELTLGEHIIRIRVIGPPTAPIPSINVRYNLTVVAPDN